MDAQQYFEVVITPAPGSSEFLVNSNGEAWSNQDDLADAMAEGIRDQGGELIEIADGNVLPQGLEDIRGRVHNEPSRVFGWLDHEGEPHYCGIQMV